MRVLVLNAGSSSLKASLVVDGEAFGRAVSDWAVTAAGAADRAATLEALMAEVGGARHADAVAHRIVHGGEAFVQPTLLGEAELREIRALASLAPLHDPPAIETIDASRQTFPAVPHVACFDTAFHATLPEAEWRYPVPEGWFADWGARRFGFHGLSVEWSVGRAASLLARPAEELGLVVAHLGGGCSVTAVSGGRSVRTSMGYTPLEGLMMGTRSGSIDPGLMLRLLADRRLTAAAMSDALEHASGLKGVSGVSGDLREVQAVAARGDSRAILAIEMFVARTAGAIAWAAAALPYLDALVFTGGIGEHAGAVRAAIVERLAVLGVPDVPEAAGGEDAILAGIPDRPAVLRIEAREDLVMAAAAERLIAG